MQKLFSKSVLSVFVGLLLSFNLWSQKTDVQMMEEISFPNKKYAPRHVTFMLPGSKNPLIRYNPVSLTFGTLLYFYQGLISAQFSTNCMYNPSCSQFSFIAVKEFGLLKGLPLSADRLMRCNKLGAVDVHFLKIDHEHGKVIESMEMFKMKKD